MVLRDIQDVHGLARLEYEVLSDSKAESERLKDN